MFAFYYVWLEKSSYCLKIFCIVRLALSYSFGWREEAFVGPFILSALVDISRLMASSALNQVFKRQKKTQGTHHYVIPWVFRSLARVLSFLPPSKSS